MAKDREPAKPETVTESPALTPTPLQTYDLVGCTISGPFGMGRCEKSEGDGVVLVRTSSGGLFRFNLLTNEYANLIPAAPQG